MNYRDMTGIEGKYNIKTFRGISADGEGLEKKVNTWLNRRPKNEVVNVEYKIDGAYLLIIVEYLRGAKEY